MGVIDKVQESLFPYRVGDLLDKSVENTHLDSRTVISSVHDIGGVPAGAGVYERV